MSSAGSGHASPSVSTLERSYAAEEEEETVTAPTVIKGLEGKPSERRCLLIYSGGTLGMRPDADGAVYSFLLQNEFIGSLAPRPGYLKERMMMMHEFSQPEMPAVTLVECVMTKSNQGLLPLLDSSDMGPRDWARIARLIEEQYFDYDGFVVIMGTDTMAYCASALSFMFENLGKPIVLTGSMVPLCELYNDARRNLIVAIVVAGYVDVPEEAVRAHPGAVCIFVNDKLTRGNRTIKSNSMGLDAFDSPNFPALVKLETGLRIHSDRFLPPPRGRFRVRTVMDMNIAVVKLVPGFSDDFLFAMLAHTPSLRGIIFELYGSGNVAVRRSRLLGAIEDALKKDIVVLVCSQCQRGAVQLGAYALGRNLARLGVVSAVDMTTEATATKLGYLLGLGLPVARVKELMRKSLRGELSENDEYLTPQGSSLHAIMARVAREDSADMEERQQLLPPGSPAASLLRSDHPFERRRASPVANDSAPGGRRYQSHLATAADRVAGKDER